MDQANTHLPSPEGWKAELACSGEFINNVMSTAVLVVVSTLASSVHRRRLDIGHGGMSPPLLRVAGHGGHRE